MFASLMPRGDAICIRLQRREFGMSGFEWDFVASVAPTHGKCLRKLVILCCTAFLRSIWD